MVIRSAGGERRRAGRRFLPRLFETAIGDGELLTEIRVPAAG